MIAQSPGERSAVEAEDYTQTGGIRFGYSFWFALNFSIPFAHIRITKDFIVLTVSVFSVWQRIFAFKKAGLGPLRWKRGIFSTGLHITHTSKEYPPFILFWPSDRPKLKEQLKTFGYDIPESPPQT